MAYQPLIYNSSTCLMIDFPEIRVIRKLRKFWGLIFLFNGLLVFVCYLMPKKFL